MGDPFFRYNCSDFLTQAAAAAAQKNAVMSYHIFVFVCWTNHIQCHFKMAHLESFQTNISPFHRISGSSRMCLFYVQPIKWFHIASSQDCRVISRISQRSKNAKVDKEIVYFIWQILVAQRNSWKSTIGRIQWSETDFVSLQKVKSQGYSSKCVQCIRTHRETNYAMSQLPQSNIFHR